MQSSASPPRLSFTINLLYRIRARWPMTMVLERSGLGVDFHWRQSLTIPGTMRAPVAPYADTKADNRLLKRKPSKYESPLISYTGITLMKLTNAGTMDRETLPWLSALNRRLQPRFSLLLQTPARPTLPVSVNLLFVQIRERRDGTRRDAMRRDASTSTRKRRCEARRSADEKSCAIRSHTSLTGD